MVPCGRYKTGLRDAGKHCLAQPHTLFESGTINHSDTSPRSKILPQNLVLGQGCGYFIAGLGEGENGKSLD